MKIARGLVVGIVIAGAVVIRDADAAVAPVQSRSVTVPAAAPQTLKRSPGDTSTTPSTTGLARVLAVHITAETVSSVIVGPPTPLQSDTGPTTTTTPSATNPRTTTRVRRTTVPPLLPTSVSGTAPFVPLDPMPSPVLPAPAAVPTTTVTTTPLTATPVTATPVPSTLPSSPSPGGPFPTVLIKPAKAGIPFSISPAPTQPFTATTAAATMATTTTAPFVPLTPPLSATPGQVIVGVIVLTPDTAPPTIQPVIAAVAAPKTTTTTTATTTTTTRTSSAPTTTVPDSTSTAPAPPVTDTTAATTIPTTKAPITYTFTEPVDAPPAPNPRAADVVALALTHVGEPYLWGGEGIGGWDCSGLSMVAWASVGVRLTHNSAVQFGQTARVSRADIQPGDLVFYGSPIHHLGIFIGDGKMVEAAREGVPVRISSIKRKDLVGIGRVR